jgi:hypothetical protein
MFRNYSSASCSNDGKIAFRDSEEIPMDSAY